MQVNILDKNNTVTGKVKLPVQFEEEIRPDLIKRAVLALQSVARQKYGAKPEAGKRASVRISKRRHDYRGTYGIGQSRTPRKAMSFRGTRFNWTGAFAPQTVGGRKAHAPKASKEWEQKINKKERQKAIRSALAATMNKKVVEERGHKLPEQFPFIINNEFETFTKTKELKKILDVLGFQEDLERAEERKVRAGKGTMRGRKYKQAKSILIVTKEECPLTKAADNIPGIEIVTIKELNTEFLAPGTTPGRLTLFTEGAIASLDKEQLFTGKKQVTEKKSEVSA